MSCTKLLTPTPIRLQHKPPNPHAVGTDRSFRPDQTDSFLSRTTSRPPPHTSTAKHLSLNHISFFLLSFRIEIFALHTHTHIHVGFYGLRGLSIGVMVFILYKLYVLLPYTYPTPKLSPHRRRYISIFPKKNSLCMIYKRFKLWGH